MFLKISKYFTIVFTCDHDISNDLLTDYTFLQINNAHPSIEKKNYVLKYLNDKEYNHDLLISVA